MLDRYISVGTFIEVLIRMGYRLISQSDGMMAFEYVEEIRPIFLYIGTISELPMDAVEQVLVNEGISLDVFHATLESM